MRLRHVKEWKDQYWTRLYESALFERDTVRLCARVWDAQLAILSRQEQIRDASAVDIREQLALRKAMIILADLQRLSGFDDCGRPQRQGSLFSSSTPKSTRSGTHATRQVATTR